MKNRVCSCDCGTAFFQTAEMDEKNNISYKTIRNAFVELPETDDIQEVLTSNGWKWMKDGNKYYVIGEDSLRVAKMFPDVELRRPLQDGVLNKGEEKKMIVLAELIESTIGKAPTDKSVVCTCVSSKSIDNSQDSTFHKVRLQGMFKRLGWNVKVIEEGLAVILAERPVMVENDGTESPYSGLGLSFGGGKFNAVLAYKGLQVAGISVARCGDWVNKKASEATDTTESIITSIKEKKLDLLNPDFDDEKIFALYTYYESMMEYDIKSMAKEFASVKSQFEAPIDIVIAGGTSMINGFDVKLEELIRGMKFPFEIRQVRKSTDPRNSVVKGCLTQALITAKKLNKVSNSEELKDILGE